MYFICDIYSLKTRATTKLVLRSVKKNLKSLPTNLSNSSILIRNNRKSKSQKSKILKKIYRFPRNKTSNSKSWSRAFSTKSKSLSIQKKKKKIKQRTRSKIVRVGTSFERRVSKRKFGGVGAAIIESVETLSRNSPLSGLESQTKVVY